MTSKMLEVLNMLVSISSIICGVAMSAALLETFILQDPQKIDMAKRWAINILIAYVLFNGIGTLFNVIAAVNGGASAFTGTISWA